MSFFNELEESLYNRGSWVTGAGVHALDIRTDLGGAPAQAGDSGIIAVGNIGDLPGEGKLLIFQSVRIAGAIHRLLMLGGTDQGNGEEG